MTLKKFRGEFSDELLRGLEVFVSDFEPETTFLDVDNIRKLIDRARSCGIEIHGIECWSSNRLDYFTAVSRNIFVSTHKIPEERWADEALDKIMDEYGKKVLERFPDDKPVFSVEYS
jgi:hypothetical protein